MPIIYNFQDPKSEYQINNIIQKNDKTENQEYSN
jgi:hypothetical protein